MKHETPEQFSLGSPSLSTLAYVLRHPEPWESIPGMQDYQWGWSCCNCAMNATHRMWAQVIPKASDQHAYKEGVMAMFGMPEVDVHSLFFGSYGPGQPSSSQRMADFIDEYIEKRAPAAPHGVIYGYPELELT